MMRRILLTLVMLLLLPALGHAAIRYVSTSGNDGNSCSASTNINTPKRNISGGSGGLACMSAGDTLYIRGGTYNESIASSAQTIPTGTTWENAPIISGYPGETVTIRPNGGNAIQLEQPYIQYVIFANLVLDGVNSGSEPIYVFHGPNHIRFQDSEVKNSAISGIQVTTGGITPFPSDIQFIRLNVHSAGLSRLDHGFYLGAPNSLIDSCVIHNNNSGYGIQLYDGFGTHGNTGTIIRNNIIWDNHSYSEGQVTISHGDNIQVYNNIIYNGLNGIEVTHGGPNNVQIYNNTLHNHTGQSIYTVFSSVTNTQIKNNIVSASNTPIRNDGSGTQMSNNLCTGSSTGCTIPNSNPGFFSAAGGDFHIAEAGSPAIGSGVNLSSIFTTDAEGTPRSSSGAWDLGAYAFEASEPPAPIGMVAKWTFDEGSLTTAADSSGNGRTCTLNTAGWSSPGIIGASSLNLNGTRYCQATGNATLKPTTQAGISVWGKNFTSNPNGSIIITLPNDAFGIYMDSTGRPGCQAYDGTNFHSIVGSQALTSAVTHISCSFKQGDGLRLRVNNAQVGFVSISGTLNYTLAGNGNAQVGRSDTVSGLELTAVLDQAYIFDEEISTTDNTNLFNESVPSAGLVLTHSRFTTPHAPEGSFLSALDSDITRVITLPIGLRWSLHNSTGASVTEYFRPFCRTKPIATGVWGAWTELTNSFGSFGIRFLTDTSVNLGDVTTAILPTDGFPSTSGRFIADVVDTTGPAYDAAQKITMGDGQHAEEEIRIEFGSPLVAGDQIQCKPRRESGADLTDYGGSGDPLVKTLTLQSITPPGIARLGGNLQGGTLR